MSRDIVLRTENLSREVNSPEGRLTFVRDVTMPGLNHFTVCSALGDASSALFAAARELTER